MKFRTTYMAGLLIVAGLGAALLMMAFTGTKKETVPESVTCATPEKACIFKTFLGMESFDTALVVHNRELTESSINRGLVWMAEAQAENGGWGSGSHQRQEVRDPHAVPT